MHNLISFYFSAVEYFKQLKEGMESMMTGLSWNIDVVVECTLNLLKTKRPAPENVIGSDGRFLWVLLRMVPAWVLDFLNTYLSPLSLVPAVMKKK